MKTKFYWLALLASAAMIAQANAGGHHGGGGGGGFAMAAHPAPAHAAAPLPRAVTLVADATSRPERASHRTMGRRHFVNRALLVLIARLRAVTSLQLEWPIDAFEGSRSAIGRETRLTRNGNDFRNRFQNRGLNVGREHVFARRTADWHRDWNRSRDHWWHGHRCHFVNGFWFIYDTGFYPYDYWYPYGYGYGYFGSAYYPYDYDPGVYEGDADYSSQGAYRSSEQYADSTVAAVQEQLAQQGYYRGEIDDIFGVETRRAVVRYQSNQGLRVTGSLNADTLRALELQRVASN